MKLHIVHHYPHGYVPPWVEGLRLQLAEIKAQQEKLMATVAELAAAVEAQSTIVDSIVTLVANLEQEVKDALADTSLSPEAQAQLDAAFAKIKDNSDKMAAAVTANTPAAPEGDTGSSPAPSA